MSTRERIAKFVAFYSFKGGVGRSMALINTAGILVGRGFRVLVIDLDLEAPGLSYLNPSEPDAPAKPNGPDSRSGFVDLLFDAKQHGQNADLFTRSVEQLEAGYTQPYVVPDDLLEWRDGSLRIMPAGKLDGQYVQRLDELNLHGLYEGGLGEPLIRAFKKRFAEAGRYDFVLVDSRTGFSDEAGICTRDLADHLMILSGLNHQNIQGTCQFLRSLRLATDGRKTFQIILSPVPNGEDALVDQREETAKSAFEGAWEASVGPFLQIPYHPQLALTEVPHIFRRRRGYLFEAYRMLERQMLRMLGHDVPTFWRKIMKALEQRDYHAVLLDLRHLIRLDQGMEELTRFVHTIEFSWFRFGQTSRFGSQGITSPHAVPPLKDIIADEQGRDLFQFVVDHVRTTTIEIARFSRQLERIAPDLAERLFKRLAETEPANADLLGNYALFLSQRGEIDRAERYFNRAIEADPNDANHLGNYGQVLAGASRLPEAEEMLLAAWRQSRPNQIRLLAELYFSLWLVSRLRGQEAGCWEAGFKFLVQRVFKRGRWILLDRMLQQADGVLPPEELEYARALARAFQDAARVKDLEKWERWRALEPLDPETIPRPSS